MSLAQSVPHQQCRLQPLLLAMTKPPVLPCTLLLAGLCKISLPITPTQLLTPATPCAAWGTKAPLVEQPDAATEQGLPPLSACRLSAVHWQHKEHPVTLLRKLGSELCLGGRVGQRNTCSNHENSQSHSPQLSVVVGPIVAFAGRLSSSY
jgi:hypothetical protein